MSSQPPIPILLTSLPDEILLTIFKNLSIQTLLNIAQVSQSFSRIAEDPAIWEILWFHSIHLLPYVQKMERIKDWKAFYKQSYYSERVLKKWREERGKETRLRSLVSYPLAAGRNMEASTTSTLTTPLLPSQMSSQPSTATPTIMQSGSSFQQQPSQITPQTTPLPTSSLASTHFPSRYIIRKNRTRLLYIGAKNSGKTVLFYHLKFSVKFDGIYYLRKFGTQVSIDVHLGSSYNVNTKKTGISNEIFAADFEVWDLEGFAESQFKSDVFPEGIILLIDSTTSFDHLIPQIQSMLLSAKGVDHLNQPLPLLILATKCKQQGAKPASFIAESLGLMHSSEKREWRVQSCCVLTLDGVQEGMQWLQYEIKKKRYMT
eukprot:TRINITY_DN1074_c0_g2_i4.p1 TRINITY_DN1074_c0_g2~~TRINITY_DN1074_c0_g2_i4.p1  ORF type:complete len:374 (-),score=67.02 TRINITY_DN1074_c0_g2_i4:2-1123(-)